MATCATGSVARLPARSRPPSPTRTSRSTSASTGGSWPSWRTARAGAACCCWRCHSGPKVTDEDYHNTGVGWDKRPPDLGRFAVTGRDADRGKFKTPTLRGVALTAPYMHDGSLATLEEVVQFYNRGGGANPNRDPALAHAAPEGRLTQQARAALQRLVGRRALPLTGP